MLNRFDLYELAAQAPEMQARFLRALHGGGPTTLREDFCGPASIVRAWVALDPSYSGVGVDRDEEPIHHARRRLVEASRGLEARCSFEVTDVLESSAPADIIAAFNFAVCELPDRGALVSYLRHARSALREGGLVAADLYGGPGAYQPGKLKATLESAAGPVKYIWEQRSADPFTGHVVNAMHFRLPDGAVLRNAFEYRWRLWSVPELREAMIEAGFASAEVYTDYGAAVDEAGDPLPVAHAEGDVVEDDFVAYVVGRRD